MGRKNAVGVVAASTIVLVTVAAQLASAAGSTDYLRPDGDVTGQWTKVGASTAWDALNDSATQPASVSTGDYITAGGSGRVTEVSLGTHSLNGDAVSSGRAWFYTSAGLASSGRAEVIWGGQVRGSTTWGGILGAGAAWRSINVTPPDQGAIDDLRLRFTSTSGSDVVVRAAYFELNTVPVPPCPLSTSGSTIAPSLPACTKLATDTASSSDPLGFWGEIACQDDSRVTRPASGGDARLQADGTPQNDSSYRRMTVLDGDDYYGERCEIGENDHRTGPTVFYREGKRRVTFMSIRLPNGFPLGVHAWQNVMQMKQTQPSDNGGGTPVLSLKAFDNEWILFHSDPGPTSEDFEIWNTPAQTGLWTRFAFDVVYSQDPAIGSIRMYADLNGDGDFVDSGETSPLIQTNTLKRETNGTSSDGYNTGASLPSHLRAGIYHDSAVACPSPGCSVEVDNVQVIAP